MYVPGIKRIPLRGCACFVANKAFDFIRSAQVPLISLVVMFFQNKM